MVADEWKTGKSSADDGGASDRLRASVAAELTLGAALLACVAVMASLPPPA